MDTNVILLTMAYPQPLFFVSLQKSTITFRKMHPFSSFVTKINDYSCYRWLLRYISAFLPCFDHFEPTIRPYLSLYRFRLPSKTAYYLHLGIIMHPNFDCIKIGVRIWWAIRDSNPRPSGYEPDALTNWANGPHKTIRKPKRLPNSKLLYRHWFSFPGRRQPSIINVSELNFRVRNGNGCDLTAISTD